MDHRDFEGGAKALDKQGTYWWREDDQLKLAAALKRSADRMRDQSAARFAKMTLHARLYGNFDQVGFTPGDYLRGAGGVLPFASETNQISFNAVAACIDTLTAKVAKNRPRPSYQTFDGEWRLQRKALKLDVFTQGVFHEGRIYEHGARVFVDAAKFGTGALKALEREGRICFERTLVSELRVDDLDGVHGTPRQLLQVKPFPREVALALWGKAEKAKEAILQAKPLDTESSGSGDLIEVREAWHLRAGKDATDGKHVIALDNAVLFEEGWTKDYFPFAFIRYVSRDCGFWGQGMAERLTGIQLEINRLLTSIREAMRLMPGRVLVERSAKVNKGHIRGGQTGGIDVLEYSQTKPEFWVPNAVSPESFAQLDRLWQRAFEQEGISMLEASSKKPAGLDSGKALREYEDINDGRFAIVGQAYEQLFVDAGRIAIDLARQLAKEKGDYEAVAVIKKAIAPVKWSEVNLDEDKYQAQAYPVSSLPSTPAYRRQEVDEWIQRGWVSPEEAPRLMNMPDIDRTGSLMTAALDAVDDCIDKLLNGEDAPPADESMGFELAVSRGTMAMLRARVQGAPASIVKSLDDWIAAAADGVPAPAPAQTSALPPALPPGAPMEPTAGPGAPMPAAGGLPLQ